VSKAADLAQNQPTPPSKTFVLGPQAFADRWKGRPTSAVHIGLRRVSAEDRLTCNSEAVKRADALMPEHRRFREDPIWQETWRVCFIHYLISYAFCHPKDVTLSFPWSREGRTMVIEDPDALAATKERCPVVSARFTDVGIEAIFDQMALFEAEDKVGSRLATDDELLAIGAAFVDGSFVERLKQAGTREAAIVDKQMRMYCAALIHLMENGPEHPMPL
jgi:hypothetical protein